MKTGVPLRCLPTSLADAADGATDGAFSFLSLMVFLGAEGPALECDGPASPDGLPRTEGRVGG